MFEDDSNKISEMFVKAVRVKHFNIDEDKQKQNQLKTRYALINMLFEQVVNSCSRKLLRVSREEHSLKMFSSANENNESANRLWVKENKSIVFNLKLCEIVNYNEDKLSLVPSEDIYSLELKFKGTNDKDENFKFTWDEDNEYWNLIVLYETENRCGKLDENAVRRILHYYFFK